MAKLNYKNRVKMITAMAAAFADADKKPRDNYIVAFSSGVAFGEWIKQMEHDGLSEAVIVAAFDAKIRTLLDHNKAAGNHPFDPTQN